MAAALGAAYEPGKPGPDEDDAAGEGRWRVVDIGVDQASMRMKRGEAKLAIDESRLRENL